MDDVSIWDSSTSHTHTQNEIGRLCGQQPTPQYFFSTNHIMFVQFNSAPTSAGGVGFQAHVQFVTTHVCVPDELVHLVNKDGAYLLSPNYPYSPRQLGSCVWRVTSADNQPVRIHFEQFSTGSNRSSVDVSSTSVCDSVHSNLQISGANGVQLGPYCGTSAPNVSEIPSPSIINFTIAMDPSNVVLSIRVIIPGELIILFEF